MATVGTTWGRFVIFWRHGSNALAAATIAFIALGLVATGHAAALGWAPVGVVVFPFLEYALHRYALHMRPVGIPWVYRLQRLVHYDHHVDTERLDRLFVPPWLLVPLALVLGGLYLLVARSWAIALALTAGSLLGLLVYEWMHYRAHTPGLPHTRWGRWMKKVHQWHHFKNERYWYGVTTPLVDHLMGTWSRVEEVPPSRTTRELHPPRP